LDETYPHNRGHTMRFWSIKHRPRQVINTTKFKSNTIGFYAIRGHSVHGFLENAKADSIAEFLRQIKSANVEYKAIITVADNFSSHHARAVQQVSGELGLMWVFLPPYSPDLNPIEFIWKSLKRTLSKGFIKDLQELKSKIDQEWDRLSGSLSFAKKWIERFLSNHKIYAELAH
jgi:transposase